MKISNGCVLVKYTTNCHNDKHTQGSHELMVVRLKITKILILIAHLRVLEGIVATIYIWI